MSLALCALASLSAFGGGAGICASRATRPSTMTGAGTVDNRIPGFTRLIPRTVINLPSCLSTGALIILLSLWPTPRVIGMGGDGGTMKKIPPRFRPASFWCRHCERESTTFRCSICRRACGRNSYRIWRKRYYEYVDIPLTLPKLTRRQYRKSIEWHPYHNARKTK